MDAITRLKLIIGDLVTKVAALEAQLEALQEQQRNDSKTDNPPSTE